MSQVCDVYRCEVKAPIEMGLTVEMTKGGLIDHIEAATFDDISIDDDLRVLRAIYLLTAMIQGMQARGDLVQDALKELPPETDFNIERSILAAIAKLQSEVLPVFKGAA